VKIQPTDLAVLCGYLLAMLAFGLWMGRRQRDAADFMLGGRAIPWWLVLFSIVATETSTVTFLSIPGFAWANDLTWIQLPIGFAIGRLLVIVILLPGYFRGELFTAYQVLHERFGGTTKTVASLLFVVTRTLADGLRLFLSAIVLQTVTGIPMEYAVVTLGVVTIVYTFLGGMRAVLWTDLIQFVVYVGGAILAFWILVGKIDGGFAGFVTAAGEAGKLRAFDFGFAVDAPYQLWAGVIGGAVLSIASHGVDQLMVQRYLCARSQRQAAWALGLSGLVVVLQFGFFLLIGAALFVHYDGTGQTFARSDRVFATFIVDELPTPALGIVLGAVFSAAMSTLSSSLNSSATALASDVWFPVFRPAASEAAKLRTVRAFTVMFGVLQIAVGIAGKGLDGTVVDGVLSIAGFVTGIVLGVFLLGILTERVGEKAALSGLVVGLATVSYFAFGTRVAWPWFALIGSGTTFLSGLAASLVLPRAPRSTPPDESR
jgi:SSS family transporter